MHVAAQRDQPGSIEALLQVGVSPDQPDKNGMSALFYAVNDDHRGAVSVLHEAKADLTRLDSKGNSVLHYAR